MKRITLSASVLLTQQFSSIHHIPSGSSSQMDLNGHTESPIRGLNSFVIPLGTNTVRPARLTEIWAHVENL